MMTSVNKIREKDLIPIILNESNLFGNNLLKAEEISSGYGIADVVLYNFNKKLLQKRKDQNLKPINSFDLIEILTFLKKSQGETINLTVLKETFPSFRNKRKEIISFLLNKGFLIQNSEEEYKKGKFYEIGFNEVIAIEAKLSNWQRGLYQAYRYRQFANRSYLALYSKYIHRALANKKEFLRFNVGLIEVVNEPAKSKVIIHIKPKKEKLKENIFSAVVFESLLSI